MDEIHLWKWRFTDEFGKRRVTSWRMTEDTVREYAHIYKDAEKVEGSLEIRKLMGRTSDWQRSLQPSESTAASLQRPDARGGKRQARGLVPPSAHRCRV